ncbi:hypothetical protein STEG23_009978, partial [Scotinomys teguina]
MNQCLDIENVTKSENWNPFKKKKLNTRCGQQDLDHSARSSAKGGQKRKRKKRKKLKGKLKKQVKQENVAPRPKKSVSRPLMETLWARFKLRCIPTAKDCLLLSFQFDVTDEQISQWFCEKRNKYMQEKQMLKWNIRTK